MRVSSETTVYFSVTTLNPIPAGGGVQVILPKWNDGAPFSLGVPYIVEDDSGPTCTPKLGVADSINCSIIYSSPYDYITIKDAFPEGREAGNTFSFYVACRKAVGKALVRYMNFYCVEYGKVPKI